MSADLTRALPEGALSLQLRDLEAAILSGERVYAFVTTPENDTPQAVRVPTMAYYAYALDKGWIFHLLYLGAGHVRIGRA